MNIEEEIVRALIAVYDPSTSSEQRVQYNKIIENFQNNSPVELVINVGFSLISREESTLNFIGWKFIEEVTRYKWNDASLELHLFLSHKIGDILESGPPESSIDSISKVFVAMMEHEWPQNWQEAIPFLEEISHRSYLHSTAVFAILRRLVENVVTLMNVADPYRRRDMYNGIVLFMPNIIEMSLSCLYSLQTSPADYFGFQTIAYTLSFFGEVLEWVPSAALAPQLNRMVDIIVGYLNTPELSIYELAARALSALAERKKETSEECIVATAFFRKKIIDTILDTVKLAAENSQSNSNHYRYLKALCGLLTSLGSHLAKVWTEKSSPPNFSLYLSAVCQIFTHPSLNLKTESLEALSNLSNHPILGQCDAFHIELENILKGLLTAIEKTGYPSQKPVNLAVHYSNMDYDDDAEWNNDLKKLREKSRMLLSFSLNRHFPLLLNILEQSIFQDIVNNPSSIPSVKWEPMVIFSKVVVQGGLDKDLFDERAKNGLIAMSDKMIQLMSQITDWDLLNEVLSIHSSLLPVLRLHSSGLTNYMELLQKILLSSKGHVALNRHVISLILRAVTLFPEYFKTEENVKLALNLYESVRPAISQMQEAQLLQIFASLSNIVESEQLKRELLEKCISPSMEYFSNYQGNFESVEKFIILNGFETAPNENFEEDDRPDVLRRKELRYHLTIMEGVVQQVDDKSPLGKVDAFIIHMAPVFFKLNSVVLELSSPKALSLMNVGYRHVSNITRGERETIYSSVGESLEVQLGKMEAERRDTRELSKNYIHQLSNQCMNIIALIASKFGEQFHSHPYGMEMLMSTVQHVKIMPEFRLRHWIRKAWKSLILSLPQERWNQMADFWAILSGHMKTTLDSMWDPISIVLNGSEQTEAEIFLEHMTCALSREYLTLLKLVYLGTDSGNQNDVRISPLGEWLFKQEIGLSPVLATVFSALSWKDTVTSQKATPLCKVFVDQMTTELPGARGILHQLASRALPKERTAILVEQLKKELRKAPVINNRLGQSLREYAREEFYNRMTLQQYDLFKEIVAWMRGHPADVEPLSNYLFTFKSEGNCRIMEFVLKWPACLPVKNTAKMEEEGGRKVLHYADYKCPEARRLYDLCLQELLLRQIEEKRDEPADGSSEAVEEARADPKACPVPAPEADASPTTLWPSISLRIKFFEEKNRLLP